MISYKEKKPRYFDKNGVEITEGCKIRWADGRIQKVYLSDKDELGTDATNPAWIADGRAFECQFGIYPLEYKETEEVEVVEA